VTGTVILSMVVGGLLGGVIAHWFYEFREDVRWWREFEEREKERERLRREVD
jgi:membrane protein YqaA with SNARE-associated domain